MPTAENDHSGSNLILAWRLYFAALAAAGILSLSALLNTYHFPGGFFEDISFSRTVLLAIILSFIGLALTLLMASWFRVKKISGYIQRLKIFFQYDSTWCSSVVILLLVTLSGLFLITLIPEIQEPFTYSILLRLSPIVLLLTLTGAISLFGLVFTRFKGNLVKSLLANKMFLFSLLLILGIFISWAWVARTQLKTEANTTGLNPLGAPILETQVFIAWLAGIFMLAMIVYISKTKKTTNWLQHLKPLYLDISIGMILWLVTIAIWSSVPVLSNWFISVPRPPNFEFYPASDAFGYDLTSQYLLAGQGLVFDGTPFIRRPLHALFLAFLHLVGGQNYESVVSAQVVFLAALPAFFYALVTALDNRVSGVMAGVLIMLREANSIAISGSVTTSHAKMLMADLPATVMIVLLALLAVTWIKRFRQPGIYPLITGGVLAMSILIRFEAILFTIVILLISTAVLNLRRQFRMWLGQIGLFSLGFVLVLSPWVWRNYQITGTIFIDSPTFRFDVIKARYKTFAEEPVLLTPTPASAPEQLDALEESAYPPSVDQQQPADQKGTEDVPFTKKIVGMVYYLLPNDTFISTTTLQAFNFVLNNPSEVAGFITTHYLNSQIQPIIYFPTTIRTFDSLVGFLGHKSPQLLWEECCSSLNYTRRMPYWRKWGGIFPRQSLVPIIITSILIAFGISSGWKRNRYTSLLPLGMSIIYFGVNALFRNSGGRYILPVDWVGMLYFSLGLASISIVCLHKLSRIQVPDDFEYFAQQLPQGEIPEKKSLLLSPVFYVSVIGLFLIGMVLPAVERLVPPHYNDIRINSLIEEYIESDLHNDEELEMIKNFLDQGGELSVGRAMYPRFFPAFQGEESHKRTFDPKPYSYLGFFLVGPVSRYGVLPLPDFQDELANAADVIVIGCPGEDGPLLSVAVFNQSGSVQSIHTRSPLPSDLTCPFPEPIFSTGS